MSDCKAVVTPGEVNLKLVKSDDEEQKFTVAHRCHGKNKNSTAKTKTLRQKQKLHGKNKNSTAKTKTSTAKTKTSR